MEYQGTDVRPYYNPVGYRARSSPAWGGLGWGVALLFGVLIFSFVVVIWQEVIEVKTTFLGTTLDASCDDGNACTSDYKDYTGNCAYRNLPSTSSCPVNPCNGTCSARGCAVATGTCHNGQCLGGSCLGTCTSVSTCPTAAQMNVKEADGATDLMLAVECTQKACAYASQQLSVTDIPGYGDLTADVTTPGMPDVLKNYCRQLLVGSPYEECLYSDWLASADVSNLTFTCRYQFNCARVVAVLGV